MKASEFKDHFSAQAALYAAYRPRYPAALFDYLASVAPARERAWDCATGNGQAAAGLARLFSEVVATDASEQQLEHAQARPNIRYRRATAEESGLASASIDLVTVAQAVHWFDMPRFFAEARRVLRPRGVVAIWAYSLLEIGPELDPILNYLYNEATAGFWPSERVLVDCGYVDIDLPFQELRPPPMTMEENWSFDHLLGYLRSWSATQRSIAARGIDPVAEIEEEVRSKWGGPEQTRVVRWPLVVRVGRG